MNLRDFLDLWLETYVIPSRAPKTAEAYKYALAHLSPMILEIALEDLQPIQLQREINTLAARYSRQAQLMFIALRAALAKAEKLGMIGKSPMRLCDPPAHEKADICYLTPEEAAAYLAAAREQPAGALLILMLCLGLRRNEARGLRAGDLGADGVLQIRRQRTKDGSQPLKTRASRRDIPVPEPLRAIFAHQEGEYLVDISEKALRAQHLRVLASIGIDRRVTLHGLRHTCATMAANSGAPLTSVQRLLGHRHFSTTADIYIHADRLALERCVLLVYNHFGPTFSEEGARLEIV